jgi:uncharacterized cofD-like protein
MDKKNVVVIGGGTGTHTVLRGLKQYQKQLNVSAVVTMADSGGSTGRLRDEFGYLPVGDVRMALAALASDVDEHEELVRALFLYRFDKGNGLSGHNFGNLLLVALTDILGSEEAAIRAASRLLGAKGTVVPVTTDKVHLVATYGDGVSVTGEHLIDEPDVTRAEQQITALTITPQATISASAEETILAADVIVLGPGDLYTSILANCVVDGVADAIRNSGATVVSVCNLMTRAGQTNDMCVSKHLAELTKYTGMTPDYALYNTASFPKALLQKYEADGEFPVALDIAPEGTVVISEDLLATEEVQTAKGDVLKRSLIRHDSRKLARTLMDIVRNKQ